MLVRRGDLALVRADRAAQVVSPAHDVLSLDEWNDILASQPDSYLHVTSDVADPAASRAAAARLLSSDAYEVGSQCLYAYEIALGDHRQLGVVGLISVDALSSGQLRPHEEVRPSGAGRLVRHLIDVGIEGSPIVAGYRPSPAVDAALEAVVTASDPTVTVDRGKGIWHRAWPITDPEHLATIESGLAHQQAYVIDGHHRATAAVEAQRASPSEAGQRFLGALFPLSSLGSRSYHRRVPTEAEPATLAAHFSLRSIPTFDAPIERSEMSVRLGGTWWAVDMGEPPIAESSPLDVLDPVRADSLLGPVLAPGGDRSLIQYISEVAFDDVLVNTVDEAGDALVLCRPVLADDVVRVADAGLFMPPKSSYFVPKAAEGLFLRVRSDPEEQALA